MARDKQAQVGTFLIVENDDVLEVLDNMKYEDAIDIARGYGEVRLFKLVGKVVPAESYYEEVK